MNDESSYSAISNALEMLGFQRDGEEILYSGMTGKMFTSSVFMGPLQFMRLKHLTQDKVNSRPVGRKEQRTHQPTGGRGNEGGMRIGEMERDVLIAHGTTSFLQESMMKRSDGTSFIVCNGCGTIPIYNEPQGLYVCSLCDGPVTFQGDTLESLGLVLPVRKSRTTFSKVEMPYSMKLLTQELNTFMNAGMRFITEKSSRTFRTITTQSAGELPTDETVLGAQFAAATAADITEIANLPQNIGADAGAEDAAEDTDIAVDGEDTGSPVVPPSSDSIVFYSKNPQYREFSNFYPANITIDGKLYPSVEHYFQAAKFPDTPDYAETIRVAKTPAQAKRLGKTRTVPVKAEWNTVRDDVMAKALKEKFGPAHPNLMKKLLETGNRPLVDGSPMDSYWGIGRNKKGKNRLGELLMKIRGELQKAAGTELPAGDAMLTTAANVVPVELPAAPAAQGAAGVAAVAAAPVQSQVAAVAEAGPSAANALPAAAPAAVPTGLPTGLPTAAPAAAPAPAPNAPEAAPAPASAATAAPAVPGFPVITIPTIPSGPDAASIPPTLQISELPPPDDSDIKVISVSAPPEPRSKK
jgi:ribA/ribD-fused uncharacterized protein